MWTALIKPVAGLFTKALDIVDDLVPDKDLAAKLKAAMTQRIEEIAHTEFVVLLQARRDIVMAEAQGESWLQRNWRPLLMSAFGIIIVNNYILNPWLGVIFGLNVVLEIPPDMWGLLKLGLTGYIVGRSSEKIAQGGGIKAALNNLMGK